MPVSALYAFADSSVLARRLARRLAVPTRVVGTHHFPDGETLVRVPPQAARRSVLVRTLHQPNAKLVETLLAADALRRAGAEELTLVAPYLPYMRQDAVFRAGESLSQRVVGKLLGDAFDRVLTVEAHLHRVSSLAEVVPGAAVSLSAATLIAAWVRRRGPGCMVAGPDSESRPWVEAIAAAAGAPSLVGRKRRLGDRRVRVEFDAQPPARRAILVDDVVSSGRTLASAARALRRGGISAVEAVVVHAIFAPGALAELRRAGVERVVSCNSVPHASNRIDLSPLLAAALSGGRRQDVQG
jgi:ribose-phosphate pyrophosphokinase